MDLYTMRAIRAELRKMERADLFKLAREQKARWCDVGAGDCPFFILYKSFGFCLSELLGKGCSPELNLETEQTS